MPKLLGKAPNQVPTNADLGSMAFQDREGINVNTALVANLVVTGATSVNTTFAVTNATSNVAFFASNGNVGFGNSTPTNKLSVNGNTFIDAERLFLYSATANTGPFIQMYTANTSSFAATRFLHPGGNAAFDVGYDTGASSYYVNRFDTSGAFVDRSFMIGRANGNIGIANTTPNRKLVIEGSTRIGGDLRLGVDGEDAAGRTINSGGDLFIRANDTGTDGTFSVLYLESGPASGQGAISVKTNTVQRMYFTSGGNVSIGNTSSSADATLALTGTANVSGNVVIGGTYLAFPNVPNTNFTANATNGFTIARDAIGGTQSLKITEAPGGHIITGYSSLNNQKPIVINATATGNTAYDYGVSLQVESVERLRVNNTITTISSDANITGNTTLLNATISGNLTVSGTTTYINTTQLNIGDNIISLNADLPGASAPTESAGWEVNRGSSSNVSFIWDETNQGFKATAQAASSGTSLIINSLFGESFKDLLFNYNDSTQVGMIRVYGRPTTPSNAQHMAFWLNDSTGLQQRMLLAANGNFGIGNTTPAQRLTVAGTANVSGITYHGANVVMAGGGSSGVSFLATTDGASFIAKPISNSTISQRLDITGVGSNNASNPFWSGIHLSPGEGPFTNSTSGNAFPRLSMYYAYTNLTNPTDLTFTFAPGNASGIPQAVKLYSATAAGGQSGIDIAANGNVGIGNTTPANKLSVTGDIKASQSITIGNGGGTYQSGSIYSDGSWGMILRAAQTSPATAHMSFHDAADARLLTIYANTNVSIGAGNTTPTNKLTVDGTIYANNLRRYTLTRAISGTVGDTIEIGTLYATHGAHSLDISIQTTDGGFSVSKRYLINSSFAGTGSTTYRRVLPQFDTGPFSNNDYELEAYHNSETIGLRLRKSGGTFAGTAEILIDDLLLQTEGQGGDYFTPLTGTATGVSTAADLFPGNRVTNYSAGNQGSNTFVVVANTTVNAITSNNTLVTFGLPIQTGTLVIGSFTYGYYALTTSATTANQVLHSASASGYRSAKYWVQATSGSTYQSTEILLIHDGTTVYKTEYATVYTGAVLATFDADINSGNLRLLCTPTNAVTTFKGSVTLNAV